MKRVIVDAEAEAELEISASFYEQNEPGLSAKFKSSIDEALHAIQAQPDRYPSTRYGTRRFVMHDFPFVIQYIDSPDTVWVIAIAHTSRKPGYWRGWL